MRAQGAHNTRRSSIEHSVTPVLVSKRHGVAIKKEMVMSDYDF
mgnify:CR=1 FL=1